MKKQATFSFVLIFIIFLMTACGSPHKSASNSADNGTGTKNEASQQTAATPLNGDRKMIQSAQASLMVKDSNAAIDSMIEWLSTVGGYEFSRSTASVQNSVRIHAVFKLPPQQLQPFISMLRQQGKMTSCDVKSEDITDQYYDASARLENLKRGREQFYEILKKANTIDEILKVQEQINTISGDIEALEGKINRWDSMVEESTVDLTISEESDPVKNTTITWKISSFSDFFQLMKNGLVMTFRVILRLAAWALIILVSLIPFILVGIVIFILIRWIRSKRRH